jgi:hypothetical protein
MHGVVKAMTNPQNTQNTQSLIYLDNLARVLSA